jgi:predicted esterase
VKSPLAPRLTVILLSLVACWPVAADPGPLAGGTAAAGSIPAAAASLPWPARLAIRSGLRPETEALAGAGWKPKGTIEPVEDRVTAVHLSAWQSPTVKKGQEADWDLVCGRLSTPAKDAKPQFEHAGGFVFVPAVADDTAPAATAPRPLTFKFVSARQTTPSHQGGASAVVIERTWFALYDPLPPKAEPGDPEPAAKPTRGLVVLMPGMFGTPTEPIVALIRRLRQEGYCVLRMLSQPSRFTESVTYALPLDGDIAAAITPIAADLGDRAAEAAYAVESAVLYAKQERPGLRTLPRFAIGMSGGAMLLPVVLAREPDAYAGAVSIAGGVDYLRILTTSNYADWIDAVRVKWLTPASAPAAAGVDVKAAPTTVSITASAKRLQELSTLYRAAAPLDSANLVGSLKAIPWLLLHGASDKAVPAETGEELWEKLGKPERIVVKGGHEWVFMTLSSKFTAITEWINKHAPQPALPAGTAR